MKKNYLIVLLFLVFVIIILLVTLPKTNSSNEPLSSITKQQLSQIEIPKRGNETPKALNTIQTENSNIPTSPVKAFGNIEFGESMEVVKQKIASEERISLKDVSSSMIFSKLSIPYNSGNSMYADLIFHFYKDKLYYYTLSSPFRLASRFDTQVIDYRDGLVNLIVTNYGKPSWERHISFLDMKDGYTIWSHKWFKKDLGEEKEIRIGITESRSEFSAFLIVEYPPLVFEKELEDEKDHAGEVQSIVDKF